MTKVFIYRGIPGSGKTYHAKKKMEELKLPSSCYFSTDNFWLNKSGEYNFDPKRIEEAHSWNLHCYLNELHWIDDPSYSSHYPPALIVDNTNITTLELAPFVSAAKAYNFDYEIITIWCELEIATKRNQHQVPFSSILKRYTELVTERLPPFWNHFVIFNQE